MKHKSCFVFIYLFLLGCLNSFSSHSINNNCFEFASVSTINDQLNLTSSNSEMPIQFVYLDIEDCFDYYKGDSIKVAIIDSGIDIDNKEFKISDKSATLKTTYTSYNTVSSITWYTYDKYPTYLDDTFGHGTNVASILASQINDYNYMGIAPNVELIVLKVTNDNNGYDWNNISGALQYILSDSGLKGEVDVINMSFQGYRDTFTYNNKSIAGVGTTPSTLLQPWINKCYQKGITMVASAGNYNIDISNNPCYPASFDHVISVGALAKDSFTAKASYSNYGNIDIVAPGYCQYTSIDEEIKAGQGTSYSTPLVSGAIALFLEKYQGTAYFSSLSGTYTHDKILSALSETSIDLSDTSSFGSGRLSISSLLSKKRLITPVLKFNNATKLLTWDEITGATNYYLMFITPDDDIEEFNLNTTQFDFSSYPLGEYLVELIAQGEDYIDSKTATIYFEACQNSGVEDFILILKEYDGMTCASSWTDREDIVVIIELYNDLSNEDKSSSIFLEEYNDNGYLTSYIDKLKMMVSEYNKTLKEGEEELFLSLPDGTIFKGLSNNYHIDILNTDKNNSIVVVLLISIFVAIATPISYVLLMKGKKKED